MSGSPGEILPRNFPPIAPLQVECLRSLCDNLLNDLVNCRSPGIIVNYEGYLNLSNVLSIIVAILAQTELPVHSFDYQELLPDDLLTWEENERVQSLMRQQPSFLTVWANIIKLHLSGQDWFQECPIDTITAFLYLALIKHASHLQTLYLAYILGGKSLIQGLGRMDLPPIQNLEIAGVAVTGDLRLVFRRLRSTLRKLTLNELFFDLLMDADSMDPNPDWVLVCEGIAELGALGSLSISQCYELEDASPGQTPETQGYSFPALAEPSFTASALRQQCLLFHELRWDSMTGVSYSGPDMAAVVALLQLTEVGTREPGLIVFPVPIRAFEGKAYLVKQLAISICPFRTAPLRGTVLV